MPRPVPYPEAKEFGARVRRRRQRKGLTIEALAELIGVHYTYVGSVERGERNIALHNIVRFAEALEVDPSVLTKGLTTGG